MGKIKDKLIDIGGYTKKGLSDLSNQDREVGPSQARMKGIRTIDPISTKLANKLDEIETAAKNKDKTRSKDIKPDFTPKSTADYPEYQEELKSLYDSAKKDDMDLPAGARTYKKGGAVKKMAKGGSASSRADGCATKGKTKGRII